MKKKPATLELIAKKLDKVDARLDKVDSRLNKIDSHLSKADSRFDKVDSHLSKVDSRLNKIDLRLDKVDSRFDHVDGRIDSLILTVAELAEATYNGFMLVQETLATKADKADIARLDGRINGFEIRLDSLETRFDTGFAGMGLKIDDLREEVMGFTSDVCDELSARIAVLEKKRA